MLLGRATIHRQIAAVVCLTALVASCAAEDSSSSDPVAAADTVASTPPSPSPDFVPMPTVVTTTTRAPTTTTTDPPSTTTTTIFTTTTTTTTAPAVGAPPAAVTPPAPATDEVTDADRGAMAQTNGAFETLARNNAVASITVRRDGAILLARATGAVIDGTPATPDTPMLVASVSKIITAIGIARLVEAGDLAVDQAVPWAVLGISPHPGWNDVTVRELLDHTSGMPVARSSWFSGGGDCRLFIPTLLASAPQTHRGTWRYSNGNYCTLGLLVEALTDQPLDAALQMLVFDPIGESGMHSSTGGLLPTDAPHGFDATRFSRLGGAGILVVSTNDLTAMTAQLRPGDTATLRAPGIFVDQYGWGHTGTMDGAVSCLWVLEDGGTTVAATIAGNSPAKGGDICDRVVPAVADDLGIGQGRPIRTP